MMKVNSPHLQIKFMKTSATSIDKTNKTNKINHLKMQQTNKQSDKISFSQNLPIIIPKSQDSDKSLYKEDTDSSRMSVNPQQLMNNRKSSIANWEPKKPNFQELSSLKKYLRKGDEINQINIKNLSKIDDRDRQSTINLSMIRFSKDFSKDRFTNGYGVFSIQKLQEDKNNIKNIYVKKQSQSNKGQQFRSHQHKHNKNHDKLKVYANLPGKFTRKRYPNESTSNKLEKNYVSQEVQTEKPKGKSARNIKHHNKQVSSKNLKKMSVQKNPNSNVNVNTFHTLQNDALPVPKNEKLSKFINLSSILEKDEDEPQPPKRLQNIRNNHMATKYLMNQSYQGQQSTAPSLLSNSYLQSVSKLSLTFNEQMQILKKNKRYDFDPTQRVNMDVIPENRQASEKEDESKFQNTTIDSPRMQAKEEKTHEASLRSKQTEKLQEKLKAEEQNWLKNLNQNQNEKKSMSIIPQQSENGNSNIQERNNEPFYNNTIDFLPKTYSRHAHNDKVNGQERSSFTPLMEGVTESFGFANNFSKKAKDESMQFPEISEVKVSPSSFDKNMMTNPKNTYVIHPIRNNFNESTGMGWIYNNYKPKHQVLQNISNETFQMKKYKNGVYFGELVRKEQNQQGEAIDIKEGKGVIFYFNGKLYEGEFKDNMKSGMGYEEFPDGSKYTGQFEKGFKNGKGLFQWANEQVYEGEWLNGKKHGSGMWKSQEGESYIGEWKDGLVEGFGVFVTKNNDRFEGEFLKSQKHGYGTERFSNGEAYVGQYKRNRPNGQGEYFYSNGDYYKGEFVNHLRHGQGFFKMNKTGETYKGQFKNDKKCGYGEMAIGNKVYSGNFQNNFKHGYGEIYEKNQCKYKGFWINDKELQDSESVLQKQQQAENANDPPISQQPLLNNRFKARINEATEQLAAKQLQKTPRAIRKISPGKTTKLSKSPANANRSLQMSQSSLEKSDYKRACGCAKRH